MVKVFWRLGKVSFGKEVLPSVAAIFTLNLLLLSEAVVFWSVFIQSFLLTNQRKFISLILMGQLCDIINNCLVINSKNLWQFQKVGFNREQKNEENVFGTSTSCSDDASNI